MQNIIELDRKVAEQAANTIFLIDTEQRVIYQNPEARLVFGFSDAELIGQPIFDVLKPQSINREPIPTKESQLYRAVENGETARDYLWLLARKDGSTLIASCTSSPLRDGEQCIGAILMVTDITVRRNSEAELLKNLQKLQIAVEASQIGLFDYFPKTHEVHCSDRVKQHFGLLPSTPFTLEKMYVSVHPEDREKISAAFEEAAKPENGGRYQYQFRTVSLIDGKERWISARGQVFFDNENTPIRVIGVTLDITERKLTEQRLREAAQHDTLTGLPNRALLFEYSSYLLAQAERAGARSALLFIDLDRFKPINDTYGHEVGDKVLKEVARRLEACTRKEDIVSRLGGDEFVVVLPRIHATDDPRTVARHILEKIGQPFLIDSIELYVSPSIGISFFREHGKDIATLLRCADLAMYAAKREGRNGFKIYDPAVHDVRGEQSQLEEQLRDALTSKRLALFYQPIIDISSGQIVGVEALIRLVDQNGKLLAPAQFMPLVENTGLINDVGNWVAHEACRQHQDWRNAGLPAMSMAINVSATQFRQRDFATHLAQAIKESGMDPNCLQIEVTEKAIMDNVQDAVSKLNELRLMGVQIALDDFGTGYSSLVNLSTLPIDKLKIDRSFIQRLNTNRSSQSVTDTIIGMGKSLNLQVVGEGIESEEVMSYLQEHGCDQAQGYLFSEPLPPTEFESWYRTHHTQYH